MRNIIATLNFPSENVYSKKKKWQNTQWNYTITGIIGI